MSSSQTASCQNKPKLKDLIYTTKSDLALEVENLLELSKWAGLDYNDTPLTSSESLATRTNDMDNEF